MLIVGWKNNRRTVPRHVGKHGWCQIWIVRKLGSSEASMRRKQMGIRSNKHGKVKETISRDKRNAEPVWRWMDLADYWNSPSWDKVIKAEVHLTYHRLLYSSLQFIGDRPKKLAFRLPSSEVWRPLGSLIQRKMEKHIQDGTPKIAI